MADPAAIFRLVEEPEPTPDAKAAAPSAGMTAALQFFLLSLKTLSQRTVLALADLFCLGTVGLVFAVWWSVPDPNAYQIVSHSIFAVFVLAANIIVRRRP